MMRHTIAVKILGRPYLAGHLSSVLCLLSRPDARGGDRYISLVCHFVPAPNALLPKHGCRCQLGHLDAARSVFEDMSSDCGFTAVARLVRKSATGANFDLALKVFEVVLRLGYLPTLPAAKAVAPVLVRRRKKLVSIRATRFFWVRASLVSAKRSRGAKHTAGHCYCLLMSHQGKQ
jgi:hypothetical protein